MSDNVIGNGSKLGYSVTSPVTWLEVTQIADISDIGLIVDELENDRHSAYSYHRKAPGMISVKPITVTVIGDKDQAAATGAVQKAMRDLAIARATYWWRAEVPTTLAQTAYKAWEFQGWVKEVSDTQPMTGGQAFTFQIVFNGTTFCEFAAGSSDIPT